MKNARLIVFLALAILSFSGFVESADVLSDSKGKDIIVVRIIDFESPAKLGDFFNFQYYLRDVSGIDDAIVVDFWIEKDGKEITYGSDNFFLGASNRSVQSKIFLPSNVESGIYTFNIKASHDEFSSTSYRTIEIVVKNGFAVINQDNKSLNIILISLVLLAILNIGLIYYIEKDKINRIFNFREAIATGEVFFEKHRFTLLVFSSFIIFGVLIYYLDYAEKLPKTFANVGYFILGVLAVLMLARIISEKFFPEKPTSRTISDKLVEKKRDGHPRLAYTSQNLAPEEKKQNEKAKKWGTRFKKINDWLQKDMRLIPKKDKAVLKNSTGKIKKSDKIQR